MDWQAVQTSTACGGPGGDRAVLEAEPPFAPPAAKATASPAAAATKSRSPAASRGPCSSPVKFLTLLLVCPHCDADRRIRAFITEAAPAQRILTRTGDPTEPAPTPGMEEVEPRLEQRPRISPARGPHAWDDAPAKPHPSARTVSLQSPVLRC